MRVMLLGATGFIGAALRARLLAEGHDVVAVARGAAADERGVTWQALDIARATRPDDWRPLLTGIEAVVNCAGALQDAPGEDTWAVHVDGIAALYRACEAANVRRIVHISAIGVDRNAVTPYSASKKAGEEALRALDLDWVVLRPSVVVGRPAYGGSALLRGLAALPVLLEIPDAGKLQIVQLDDLVATVLFFLGATAPTRLALDVAGPDRLSLEEVVLRYRRWLGLPEPRRLRLPRWIAALAYRGGDVLGLLGWRTPMRSNARIELVRGAVGDPRQWTDVTGIQPASLTEALAAEPAYIQERWYARLYFLKPLVFVVLAGFWIATGIVSLGPGWEVGLQYMVLGGAGRVAAPAVVAGALADIIIGIGIAVRRTARWALWAALALSILYIVIGTALLPALWADPLGPMMKIWPIMALNLVALAILADR